MAKKLVKLTESDLHRIIKESVNKILKEEKNVIPPSVTENPLYMMDNNITRLYWNSRGYEDFNDAQDSVDFQTLCELTQELEEFLQEYMRLTRSKKGGMKALRDKYKLYNR